MHDLSSAPLPPPGPRDRVRGPDGAPLVIAYLDFSCPHCAAAHARLREHALRVAYRHFALRARDPRSVPLACAAEAAALQDRFWEFADALFEDQGHTDDPHLWERASRLGMDVGRFERDRRSAAVAGAVSEQVRAAIRAGIALAPTLCVGEDRHQGTPPHELLSALAAAA